MLARKHRSPYEIGSEIVAHLMWGPKTWPEVEVALGLTGGTSRHWLAQLRASGVIRICGYTVAARQRRRARIWSIQTAPFALPDEAME